jgi:hypothetical protein
MQKHYHLRLLNLIDTLHDYFFRKTWGKFHKTVNYFKVYDLVYNTTAFSGMRCTVGGVPLRTLLRHCVFNSNFSKFQNPVIAGLVCHWILTASWNFLELRKILS